MKRLAQSCLHSASRHWGGGVRDERLSARQPIDDLVPDAVARHIVNHHLYGAVGGLHGND